MSSGGPPPPPPIGTPADRERFADLTAEDFRRLATEDGLSPNERSGFPDAFRSTYTDTIYDDLCRKLPALSEAGAKIVDIGTGCSDLAVRISARARDLGQHLILVDHPEVLALRSDESHCVPVPGLFPLADDAMRALACADVVIAYSVVQYIPDSRALRLFVESAAALLSPAGRLLVADIPNADMRQRFTGSARGREYHAAVWGPSRPADATPPGGVLSDAVLLDMVSRIRASGLHAWLVPQAQGLPMAPRREDLLIERP
jgi:hypothetical protein